jgi:hypothetical protein
MKILNISNPVITADAFAREFSNLEGKDLSDALREVYDGAVLDSQTDDSGLCAVLDEQMLGEYAIVADTFKKALEKLKTTEHRMGEAIFSAKETIPLFSNLVAWRQVLSVFRTVYGP